MAENSAKFNLVIGAVDQFSAPFKAFGSAMDSGAGKLKKLGKEYSSFKKSLDKGLGFSQTKAAIGGLGIGLANVGGEAKKLVGTLRKLGAIVGLAGGGLAGGIYKLTKSFAEAGAEAADMAQKIGLTTRQWQSMASAAKISGIETSVLQTSYEKLNQSLIAAASGGKTQARAFKTLGVGIKSLNEPGKLKATETLMTDLAEAFSKLPNDAKKAALATQIFGQAGTKILPMLNIGAAGLEKLRLKAADSGLVFSDEDIAASLAFNTTLAETKETLTGLGNIIGSAFLPVFTEIVKIIGELVNENKNLIKTKVNEWATKLQEILPKIKDGLRAFVKAIPKTISKIGEFATSLGGWKTIGKAAALVLAGPLLKSIVGLAGPIKALGKAIMTTPLGLILGIGAGLAALMAHAGVLEPFLGGVSEGFGAMSDAISESFVGLLSSLGGLFGDIGDGLFKANGEIDPEAWKELGKAIGEFTGGALAKLINFLTGLVDLLRSVREGLEAVKNLITTGKDMVAIERANEAEELIEAEYKAKEKAGTLTEADRALYKKRLESVELLREMGEKPFSSVITMPTMSYKEAPKMDKMGGFVRAGDRQSMAPKVVTDVFKAGSLTEAEQAAYKKRLESVELLREMGGKHFKMDPLGGYVRQGDRYSMAPKALTDTVKAGVRTTETKHTETQRAEVNIRVTAEGGASASVTSKDLPANAKITDDGSRIGLSNLGG